MVRIIHFIGITLVVVGMQVHAETAGRINNPFCNPSWPGRDILQAEAQKTVPSLLRNGFDTDGQAYGTLNLVILIPPHYIIDSDLPCPDLEEPVRDVHLRTDGTLRGYVVHNSRSLNSAIFGEYIVFDPSFIVDWSYRPDEADAQIYGDYSARAFVAIAPDGGSAMMHLSPDILPPDWN